MAKAYIEKVFVLQKENLKNKKLWITKNKY